MMRVPVTTFSLAAVMRKLHRLALQLLHLDMPSGPILLRFTSIPLMVVVTMIVPQMEILPIIGGEELYPHCQHPLYKIQGCVKLSDNQEVPLIVEGDL